jgi:hypothetical protein
MDSLNKKFKTVFGGEKDLVSSNVFKPHRDWKILLLVPFVLLVFLLPLDYLIYKNISKEDIFVTGDASVISVEMLKTSTLNTVENYFNNKKTVYSGLEKSSLIDPSL